MRSPPLRLRWAENGGGLHVVVFDAAVPPAGASEARWASVGVEVGEAARGGGTRGGGESDLGQWNGCQM